MSQQARFRIVVADSDSLFRLGVKSLLGATREFELVGEACDGAGTIALVKRLAPDILLLDVGIGGVSALEILDRLRSVDAPTHVVLLASDIDRATTRRALLRGARGVLTKDLAPNLLTKCIRRVALGELWIGRSEVEALVDALRRAQSSRGQLLSTREIDIVAAVIEGASNKAIAERLGVGEQTIKNHLRRIFAKLQVANRVELALHAVKHGLVLAK